MSSNNLGNSDPSEPNFDSEDSDSDLNSGSEEDIIDEVEEEVEDKSDDESVDKSDDESVDKSDDESVDKSDDESVDKVDEEDESDDEEDESDDKEDESDDEESDSDDEESDSDEEEYIKKFDEEMRTNFIVNTHPESVIHNYEELAALAHIIRDKDGNIVDELHKTLPFITKYEKTKIIGQRAKQINSGSKPFIKVNNNIIDGALIAQMELEKKKIPFILRRPIPNGGSEYWKVKDLEILI
jgi:DNA-directed RNA polymerase subunit K/omega